MTEEEIEYLKWIASTLYSEENRGKTARLIESLLADKRRLDWLESQKRIDVPWEGENSIVYNWSPSEGLRESLDRRMQA